MATLQVDTLAFHFKPSIDARKYDESKHYQALLPQPKAVDVSAVEWGHHPKKAWLIEAKDYRNLNGLPKDHTPSEIAKDVMQKVEGTTLGLRAAAVDATEANERDHAARIITVQDPQLVFHLEPYAGIKTKLFPDPTADVYQKLKQLARSTVLVLSIATTPRSGVPWTVS